MRHRYGNLFALFVLVSILMVSLLVAIMQTR
jgi:hypothetical protein